MHTYHKPLLESWRSVAPLKWLPINFRSGNPHSSQRPSFLISKKAKDQLRRTCSWVRITTPRPFNVIPYLITFFFSIRARTSRRTRLSRGYPRTYTGSREWRCSRPFPCPGVNTEYSYVQDHLSCVQNDNSLLLNRLSVLKNSSPIPETDTFLYSI